MHHGCFNQHCNNNKNIFEPDRYHSKRISHLFWIMLQLGLQKAWVKVQFRGPKFYRKEGALFQEESYLLRIFRSSYLNLHTFHLINIVFDGKFSSVSKASQPPTIGKTIMFWLSTLWSWRHNVGACWSHQVEMENFLANMSWILHNRVTWQ